jgi:hypothetical protein
MKVVDFNIKTFQNVHFALKTIVPLQHCLHEAIIRVKSNFVPCNQSFVNAFAGAKLLFLLNLKEEREVII